MLSLSREDYIDVITKLLKQSSEKTKLFNSIFSKFHENYIQDFAGHFAQKHFKKGDVIFLQNEKPSKLYLLSTGDVTLFKDSDGIHSVPQSPTGPIHTSSKHISKKTEIPIVSILSGQLFGEELLLNQPCMSFTAIAQAADTVVFFLDSNLFKTMKDQFDVFFQVLIEQASQRTVWRQKRTQEALEKHKVVYTKAFQEVVLPMMQRNVSLPTTPKQKLRLTGESFHSLRKTFTSSFELEPKVHEASAMNGNEAVDNAVLIQENVPVVKSSNVYRARYSRMLRGPINVEDSSLSKVLFEEGVRNMNETSLSKNKFDLYANAEEPFGPSKLQKKTGGPSLSQQFESRRDLKPLFSPTSVKVSSCITRESPKISAHPKKESSKQPVYLQISRIDTSPLPTLTENELAKSPGLGKANLSPLGFKSQDVLNKKRKLKKLIQSFSSGLGLRNVLTKSFSHHS